MFLPYSLFFVCVLYVVRKGRIQRNLIVRLMPLIGVASSFVTRAAEGCSHQQLRDDLTSV
ncbi:MAG: hypothetical protein KatS3mg113_0952 [Planctomycetaceae bacterium]|nr:MAG: hypothetical protein KatS3mg113_0952 [Planctomycetaceae bacterium]